VGIAIPASRHAGLVPGIHVLFDGDRQWPVFGRKGEKNA
jgi:hypothetical protein